LVEAGDARGVIRLVERWLEYGTVSQRARIAQSRAFLDLCLMDRAWVCLREAAIADPSSTEVQLLTATMFIERGWPVKAAELLDKLSLEGVGDDVRRQFATLRASAAGPPKLPPSDVTALERAGDGEKLVGLAERYLAVGMIVRAERVLERLLRDGFSPPRVSDLLWALRGDFVSAGQSTAALLDELADDGLSAEWGGVERTDALGGREVTAHVDVEALNAATMPESDKQAFPALFRRDEHAVDFSDTDGGEVTMATVLAVPDDTDPVRHSADPGLTPIPGHGDTRIMEVIHGKDGVDFLQVDGRIHKRKGAGRSTSLDLGAHRAAMLPPENETHLEDEDKELIVLTRREGSGLQPRSRKRGLDKLLRKSIHTQAPPPTVYSQENAGILSTIEERAGVDPDTDDLAQNVTSARQRTQQMLVGMAAIAGLTAACGWLVVAVLHWVAGGQIIAEAHQAVASADFRTLQEIEVKLESQIEMERAPVEVRKIELALIQTVLWFQYTGDAERMTAAQDGFATARAGGAPAEEIALVEAYLRLAMGDVAKARVLVDRLEVDDVLHRDIVARVALHVASDEESQALLDRLGPLGVDTPLVELLSRESLATVMDDMGVAESLRVRLLADHADNPFVQIVRFNEQWDDVGVSASLALLADVMETLPGPVAPRQEGRLHAQRAQLLTEGGEFELAEQSWSAALLLDPSHPRYLYRAASERLSKNGVVGALDDIDRCLGARPWDYSCRSAMIQTLIELDRLETARRTVDAWRDMRTPILAAWVSLAEGENVKALAVLEGEGGTLVAYIRGMAMYGEGSGQASALLGQVIEAWSDIPDYMTRVLVGRARVARAILDDPLADVELLVRQWAPTDPYAYVLLARVMENAGQRASAERLYQEAAAVGPEHALAQHALGLFWFEPQGDFSKARRSWRRYLELQPNGERARRARARMGRR